MRVTADTARCIGSGQCAMLAPDVFDQRDEDGVVVLLTGAPAPDLHEVVREAAARCPSAAIQVTAQAEPSYRSEEWQ